MYLSHHYLIDLTGGACLSVMVFYLFMPEEFKDSDQIVGRDEYQFVADRSVPEMDLDEEIRKLEEDGDMGMGGDMDEEQMAEGSGSRTGGDRQKTKRSVSWGETKVMGEQQ